MFMVIEFIHMKVPRPVLQQSNPQHQFLCIVVSEDTSMPRHSPLTCWISIFSGGFGGVPKIGDSPKLDKFTQFEYGNILKPMVFGDPPCQEP